MPHMVLGRYKVRIEERLRELDRKQFVRRLMKLDAGLWTRDPNEQKLIQNRLGWLSVPDRMASEEAVLNSFVEDVRRDGFKHVLLLGMGGSSLFPEVCQMSFGVKEGYLDLKVLDSTDPASVIRTEDTLDLSKTLLVISSKSGTTVETLSFYAYFAERLRAISDKPLGTHCVAITDPGTPLENLGREQNFRHVFINPPEVGGRYSALSYFGLVPAALIGVNVKGLLDRARSMMRACGTDLPSSDNPGLWLGATLAEFVLSGRDKLTFVRPPELTGFGYWLEQLLAESIGKKGKGIVPVEGEPVGDVTVYGDDRAFVLFHLAGSSDEALEHKLEALEKSGHPIICFTLDDLLDIGAECFRWEYATAVAGALLGVNPFDEPNVRESKDNTNALLNSSGENKETFQRSEPLLQEGVLALYGNTKVARQQSLDEAFIAFLRAAEPGDYVAIMAYLDRTAEHDALLQSMRLKLRDGLCVVTTLGYGPRFLHSTGQLHKGGPNKGLFIQLTVDHPSDVAVPGKPYSFGMLQQAQALGDLGALQCRERRCIRFHLGGHVREALEQLVEVTGHALSRK